MEEEKKSKENAKIKNDKIETVIICIHLSAIYEQFRARKVGLP